MNIITKLTLTLTGLLAISSPIFASEIERDKLCSKFPLNSRCENYQSVELEKRKYQLKRASFCERFPLNSQCQQPPVELLKLNLNSSGKDNEWIRIEKKANTIKLLHTTKVKDTLVSGIFNGALGALVPVPLPFVEANKYDWEEHEMIEVSFKSDRCNNDDCVITGKDTLVLPEETNIYDGLFTINYQEKDLERSLSFRIPQDAEIETVDTITFEH